MKRVVGRAVADHLSQNVRAARTREVEALEDQYARAFRHHKAITRTIKRSTGERWGVVGSRHGMNNIKSTKRERRDGRFRVLAP